MTLAAPEEAIRFCAARAAWLTCLSDMSAEMRVYAAYGLNLGSAGQLLGTDNWTAAVRATLGGHTQGVETLRVTPARRRMMPGTFVVGQDGILRAVHYARFAGDLPELASLLRSLDRRRE